MRGAPIVRTSPFRADSPRTSPNSRLAAMVAATHKTWQQRRCSGNSNRSTTTHSGFLRARRGSPSCTEKLIGVTTCPRRVEGGYWVGWLEVGPPRWAAPCWSVVTAATRRRSTARASTGTARPAWVGRRSQPMRHRRASSGPRPRRAGRGARTQDVLRSRKVCTSECVGLREARGAHGRPLRLSATHME